MYGHQHLEKSGYRYMAITWHLIPYGDIRPHEQSETCYCAPMRIRALQDNIIIVHEAFDQRVGMEQVLQFIKNSEGTNY